MRAAIDLEEMNDQVEQAQSQPQVQQELRK